MYVLRKLVPKICFFLALFSRLFLFSLYRYCSFVIQFLFKNALKFGAEVPADPILSPERKDFCFLLFNVLTTQYACVFLKRLILM